MKIFIDKPPKDISPPQDSHATVTYTQSVWVGFIVKIVHPLVFVGFSP